MIKGTGSDNDEEASLVQPLDGGWVVEFFNRSTAKKMSIQSINFIQIRWPTIVRHSCYGADPKLFFSVHNS